VGFYTYESRYTPLSLYNSFSLSTHLELVFARAAAKDAVSVVFSPAKSAGKDETAVCEQINPPIAAAPGAPAVFNSCEIAIVCYAN